MTTYEKLSSKIDKLVEQGQRPDISVGQREAYFAEAQKLREILETMTIEEAGADTIEYRAIMGVGL